MPMSKLCATLNNWPPSLRSYTYNVCNIHVIYYILYTNLVQNYRKPLSIHIYEVMYILNKNVSYLSFSEFNSIAMLTFTRQSQCAYNYICALLLLLLFLIVTVVMLSVIYVLLYPKWYNIALIYAFKCIFLRIKILF